MIRLVQRVTLLCVLLATVSGISFAQSFVLDLPRPSQRAQITQRIGITDITISYHRPMINNRKVWGDLVPYGKVWRAGANENTTIAFSDDVTIEGKPLAAGASLVQSDLGILLERPRKEAVLGDKVGQRRKAVEAGVGAVVQNRRAGRLQQKVQDVAD